MVIFGEGAGVCGRGGGKCPTFDQHTDDQQRLHGDDRSEKGCTNHLIYFLSNKTFPGCKSVTRTLGHDDRQRRFVV